MAPTFPQLAARLAPGYQWVDLYTLDCTPIGGEVYYWTAGPDNGASVVFGGNTYLPRPIEAEGLEWNGQGPLPTPTLSINNVDAAIMALLIGAGDLLGCTVTMISTYTCFLDDGVYADSSAFTEPSVFRVDRKAHADKQMVQLELAATTDQEGKRIPFRLVLQNCCTHTYRVYNPTIDAFTYGTCPYNGSNYFTSFTVPTTDPTQDQCGRRLRDCVARFGMNTPLPTRAFPGVAIQQGG